MLMVIRGSDIQQQHCGQQCLFVTGRLRLAEMDKHYSNTQAQNQALKLHWIGTPVASRDPRVSDQLLKPWRVRSWKE